MPLLYANLVSQVQFTWHGPTGLAAGSKGHPTNSSAGMQRRSLQKPILVITITDGEPTGEPRGSVVNVGKDTAAQAYLAQLDNDPEVGRNIDATSYYELEAEEFKRKGLNLTPDVWLVKLMMGAIDSIFDAQD
ncbi:hypothetical protein WJX84_000316 [Apatococcus fuscideae]|uniref:VWFA domain-containing protein n=1 Tax=Apatococcus fuscideae TaxID=2026836 RepID=A0AAW1SU67_9CHLO